MTPQERANFLATLKKYMNSESNSFKIQNFINSYFSKMRNSRPAFKLQSQQRVWNAVCHQAGRALGSQFQKLDPDDTKYFIAKLLCDTLLFMDNIKDCNDARSLYKAYITYILCRFDYKIVKSLHQIVSVVWEDLSLYFTQSAETFFQTCREKLDNFEEFKCSPVFEKIYKLIMYALSFSIFDKVGINMDKLGFNKLYQESIRNKYHMGVDFVQTILDSVLFIMERGYQCMVTGSMDPIYHNGSAYTKWFDKTRELKEQFPYLNNPEIHGINVFQWLSDLDHSIDQGESISKHLGRLSKPEKNLVNSILSNLKLMRSEYLSKKDAMKTRKAPFSVLLSGPSGIGKSTFTKILIAQYGKTFDLPVSDEFVYTRNPVDPYWVNFNSRYIYVILDDIAYLLPGANTSGDASLMEMIQVVNNVPFVPVQADLADKGRLPMKSRFVIGTTNTRHLNAHAYFSCPVAVQRRFPYILEIVPKKEYSREGGFLDSSKVPKSEGYPNLWDILVRKVVPIEGSPNQGKFVDVISFTDIHDFLAWFSKEAVAFEGVQEKVLESCSEIKDVTICKMCFYPTYTCKCVLQSDDYILTPFVKKCFQLQKVREHVVSRTELNVFCRLIFNLYFKYKFFACMLNFICYIFGLGFDLEKYIIGKTLNSSYILNRIEAMGNKVQKDIGIIPLFVFVSSTFAAICLFMKTSSMIKAVQKKQFEDTTNIGKPIHANDKKQDVWKRSDFKLLPIDLNTKTLGYSQYTPEQLCSSLKHNLVKFISRKDGVTRENLAICLRGNIFLVNAHGIFIDGIFSLEVQMSVSEGLNPSFTSLIDSSCLVLNKSKDLAFVCVRGMCPKKDITQLFSDVGIGNYKGYYLTYRGEDNILINTVENIHLEKDFSTPNDLVITGWKGVSKYETLAGQCGSPLIIQTGYGPMIGGIHMLGCVSGMISTTYHIFAIQVTKTDIDLALRNFKNSDMVVSKAPVLSCQARSHELTVCHDKSPALYVQSGSCEFYGSFKGWRSDFKTSIKKSVISDSLSRRGISTKYNIPRCLKWQPWYHALEGLTPSQDCISPSILDHCVTSFTKDILDGCIGLDQVQVLDDCSAINGDPQTMYIDSIKRSTSAGFPWVTNKRVVLEEIDNTDLVDITPEIKERVLQIISCYHNDQRWSPVFQGSIKDELVSNKKLSIGKLRVFCGAPVDWAIVMRKYILPVIRFLQLNRYKSENAIGIIAQSREWTSLHDHLTKHGKDRMIAGDFANFDKGMTSQVIKASMQVVRNICEAAGYSSLDLKVVDGITNDLAYAWVNLGGDLFQFKCGNPSGHPGTTPLNSIANSLYMRYAYTVLSPDHSCVSYQSNVSAISYGDDNVLNSSVDWFNHSTISEVLASANIEYTMADKETESKPYIDISEVTFLKRSFRWDPDLELYTCPLDRESIHRSLMYTMSSKHVCDEKLTVLSIEAVNRENFFLGKNFFESQQQFLKEIVEENNLQSYVDANTFLSWNDLAFMFKGHEEKRFLIQSLEFVEEEIDIDLEPPMDPEEFAEELAFFPSMSLDDEPEPEYRCLTARNMGYFNRRCSCERDDFTCCMFEDDDVKYAVAGVIDPCFWNMFLNQSSILGEYIATLMNDFERNDYDEYRFSTLSTYVHRDYSYKLWKILGEKRIRQLLILNDMLHDDIEEERLTYAGCVNLFTFLDSAVFTRLLRG